MNIGKLSDYVFTKFDQNKVSSFFLECSNPRTYVLIPNTGWRDNI